MTDTTVPAASTTTVDAACGLPGPWTALHDRMAAGDDPYLDDLPEGVGEVPLLGAALVAARAADRAIAQLVSCLLELEEHQIAEAITGIPLEQWLAIVGRRTRSDRRMLLTTCEVLRRLPSLRSAFLDDATVSWAQTRTVVLQVERLPRQFDDTIDASLAATIAACRDSDPDVLTSAVSRALRSIELAATPAPADPDPTSGGEEFLAIQPRLDGSGGSVYGEFDGVSLATIDAALSPPPHEQDGGGRGAAARSRARRLVEVCDGALAGAHPDDEAEEGSGSRSGSRPQLLVRISLTSLLGDDALPGELLTRLTGGRLWADAGTVRQIVEQRGADLRTIILDDCGQVVGIGQRNRVPTRWLRDAALALHDTCSGPGCQRPARSCDLDHARPWHPTAPGEPGGRTDIDELAPLCRTHNRTKEQAGWQVTQAADGSRTWHHPGTGLTTITRPATWQPPNSSPSDITPGDTFGDERPPSWDTRPPPDLAREPRPVWDTQPRDLAREHRPIWDTRRPPDVAREHRPVWDPGRAPPQQPPAPHPPPAACRDGPTIPSALRQPTSPSPTPPPGS